MTFLLTYMLRIPCFFKQYYLLFGLILIFVSSSGYAQGSPTNQQLEQAQSLVEQGQQAISRKQYLKGIKAYQQAHQIIPDPTNLYIIARAYGYMTNQCLETLKAWTLFFKGCKKCSYRDDGLRRQAKQKKRCLATLKISTIHPQIKIQVDQKKWQILKEGSTYIVKGIAGQKLKVNSQLKGYFSTLKTLTFKPNQQEVIYQVKLIPLPNPQPLIPTWSSWTLIGLGAASLGWAIFQYNDAQNLTTQYRGIETDLGQYQSGKKQFEQIVNNGNLGLGIGSALVIAGSAFLMYKKSPKISRKNQVANNQRSTNNSFTLSFTPVSSTLSWQF